MSTYTPDRWMLVRINGDKPHYRVFGSWYGGYLHGDSWRMNSGVKSYKEDDTYYYFSGESGSEYKCRKQCYGASGYGRLVLASYEQKGVTVLEECPDMRELRW